MESISDALGREPDVIITSADLEAEGYILDPEIYGEHVKYRDMPVNRWTSGVRDVLRDYFASGTSGVPFWGVLADVLQGVLIASTVHHQGQQDIPPFEFRVPPFTTVDGDTEDRIEAPEGVTIWLEPNDVSGWTALLPSEH
jgi:hypothetical protein